MSSSLGIKVKNLRKQKGLTLDQLARKIGSGKGYVWEIENRGLKPSTVKLDLLSRGLDVTADYLINDHQADVGSDMLSDVIYKKICQLSEDDRNKIMCVIDAWNRM